MYLRTCYYGLSQYKSYKGLQHCYNSGSAVTYTSARYQKKAAYTSAQHKMAPLGLAPSCQYIGAFEKIIIFRCL